MTENIRSIIWNEAVRSYHDWLKAEAFPGYGPFSPLGYEVEALAHIALNRKIPAEVLALLQDRDSNQTVLEAWNATEFDGLSAGALDAIKSTTIMTFRAGVMVNHHLAGHAAGQEIMTNALATAMTIRGNQLIYTA